MSPTPLTPDRGATPIRALFRHRTLLANFYRREIRNRYIGSASGMFWALLHPLLLLGVYTFIFAMVFRPPELAGRPYLIYVAIGLWPWLAFQEALQRGAISIQTYSGLIKKVAFPHELAVYGSVGATFTLHLAGYVLVLLVLWALGQPLTLIGLPLAMLLWLVTLVAACGFALALAAVQVFLKDTEHVLGPLMQILMYLAPILYPLSLVPPDLRPWVAANPVSYVLERLHDALEGGLPLPVPSDLWALGVAALVLVLGRALFLRLSPYFEDFV